MSHRRPADEDLLFDLPLDSTQDAPAPEIEQPPLPLEELETAEVLLEEVVPDSHVDELAPADDPALSVRPPAGGPPVATLRQRAAAGLTDLGVCAAVMVMLLVALLAQGLRPALPDWPAGVLFLLTFSFLYAVLPLAFWGRTPGMALIGLKATTPDGRPLTFRQAVLKWLGSVLTVALVGLPLLLALGGRSLSDLLSGSLTRPPGPPRLRSHTVRP
ncbi:MAG: RDD family protein [Thermoanaerobaculia bacterium]